MGSKVRAILGIGLLFSLLLFLWGCNPGTITGTVIDEATSKPVGGAQISIGNKSTESGATGSYQITGIPVGAHTLKVTAPGYQEYTEELKVKQGAQIVDISLTPITTAAPTLPEEPVPSTEEVIGPEGGTVIGPNEVKLEVPPQALAEETTIAVKQIAEPPALAAGASFAGPSYEISLIQDTVLTTPAKLTLPLFPDALIQRAPDTILTVAYWEERIGWVPLGGEIDEQSKRITVEVSRFSWFSTLICPFKGSSAETEHFIVKSCDQPKTFDTSTLADRLEHAWRLFIDQLGYEVPIPLQLGRKIEAWIVDFKGPKAPEGQADVNWWEEFLRFEYLNARLYIDANTNAVIGEAAAHELFHVIQINSYIHPRSSSEWASVLWWMEATATWAEAKASLAEKSAIYQKYYRASRSQKEKPLWALPLDDNSETYRPYLAGTFARYLEEKYGAEIIKETWERISLQHPPRQAVQRPLQAIDEVLRKHDSSLSDDYLDFLIQYAYAREPQWLQQTMELVRNRLETAAALVEVGIERGMKTIQGDHLSGSAFRIVPEQGASGTLNLGFDRSRSDDAWRVRLFVEKKDGNITSVDIAPPTQEYKVANFGEDVKGIVIVAANTLLNKDNTSLRLTYNIAETISSFGPDCTVVVQPGESIQEAIDQAAEGAVICLTSGTWEEHVEIAKSLTIRGTGPEQTVLWNRQSMGGIYVKGARVVLENIKVFGNAISVGGSARASLIDSQVSAAENYGLYIGGFAQVNLIRSHISDNRHGLQASDSAQVTLTESQISGNAGRGLLVMEEARVSLIESQVSGNGWYYYYESCIICVSDRARVSLTSSQIYGNGQGLHVGDEAQVSLQKVQVSSNGNGLWLGKSVRAEINDSWISDNSDCGIEYSGAITGRNNWVRYNAEDFCGSPLPSGFLRESQPRLLKDEVKVCPQGCEFSDLALAIAVLRPGGVMRVQVGTYQGMLTVVKDLVLEGVGWDKITPPLPPTAPCIGRPPGYPYPSLILLVTGEAVVEIHNFQVSGIYVEGSTRVSLANLLVIGWGWEGLWVKDEAQVSLTNSQIFGNEINGILVEGSARVSLIDSEVFGNCEDGLYVKDAAWVTLTNSTISGNDTGISVWGSAKVEIQRTRITNNDWWGVWAALEKCGYGKEFTGQVVFQGDNTIEGNNARGYLDGRGNPGDHPFKDLPDGQVCLP